MSINPVPRKSLTEIVAGKLVASMLNDTLKAGSQLPPERELMSQLAVSRSTLREALKMLAENHLIEARPGVGWFVCSINEANFARAHELARSSTNTPVLRKAGGLWRNPHRSAPPAGRPEKPLHIPNLRTDRLGTFDFISWWERETVEAPRSWWSAPARWATRSSRTWR